MSSSSSKITLRSSDGEMIMVEKSAAMMSGMLKNKFENVEYKGEVIVNCNCEGKLLSKIMEYCEIHANQDVSDEELKAFDVNFLKAEELPVLFSLQNASFSASFALDIESLYNLTKEAILSKLRASAGKPIEYGPEYEMELRAERAKKFGRTSTRRVSGIECLVQSNQDVIKYTPYDGVFMYFPNIIVAAAGKIPEHMMLKNENALTFSFPSVGMEFGKTLYGLEIQSESVRQSEKHYNEAYKRALSAKPPNLGSSAMQPCTIDTSSSSTSDMRSSPTIQVCLDPTCKVPPLIHASMYNKIYAAAKRVYRHRSDDDWYD